MIYIRVTSGENNGTSISTKEKAKSKTSENCNWLLNISNYKRNEEAGDLRGEF